METDRRLKISIEKHESKIDIRAMNDESKVELPEVCLGRESVA